MDNLKDDVLLVLLRWRDKFYGEDVKENDAGAVKAVVELTAKDQEIVRLEGELRIALHKSPTPWICPTCKTASNDNGMDLFIEIAELKDKIEGLENSFSFKKLYDLQQKLSVAEDAIEDIYSNRVGHREDNPLWSANQYFWKNLDKALKTIRGET